MLSIPHEAYVSPAHFQLELDSIFRCGLFVCTAALLAQRDSYISFPLGRQPVTLRHTHSGFAAFENICLHRGSLIDPPGMGCRPFRCAYHGWSYNDEGRLRHAENDPRQVHHCQLSRFNVTQSDDLVFASAKDVSGETIDARNRTLREIGYATTKPFFKGSLSHPANWKLLVENVIEQYHVSFVHPESFVPSGLTSTTPFQWAGIGKNSWAFSEFVSGQRKNRDDIRRLIPKANGQYRHAYIFPNLFLSVTMGLVAYTAYFIPDCFDTTVLYYELGETELLQQQSPAIREFVKNRSIEFTDRVLNEDLEMLKLSQMGLANSRACHQIQPMEPRVSYFHKIYAEAMNVSA